MSPNSVLGNIKSVLMNRGERMFDDVTLVTTDDMKIGTCKVFLAIQSSYFKALLYNGAFTESSSTQIKVNLPSVVLEHIIEYCCMGSVTDVENASLGIRMGTAISLEEIIQLIDLAAGADYCHLEELKDQCVEIIGEVASNFPQTFGFTIEGLKRHPRAALFNSLRIELIERASPHYVRKCFDVPECVLSPDQRAHPENINNGSNVLSLSSDTLKEVLLSDLGWYNPEYILQTVCFWGTNGAMLGSKKHKELKTRLGKRPRQTFPKEMMTKSLLQCTNQQSQIQEEDVSLLNRWEESKSIAQKIDLTKMRPLFLHKFVEDCGLVEQREIYRAYRYIARSKSPRVHRIQPSKLWI